MPNLRVLLFLLSGISSTAQITWQELPAMPEPVTNNAVTSAIVNGSTHIFSFTGMDTTKSCGQAHLRSYMYNTETANWTKIADVPYALGGVVAAGASTIKNEIYVLGGYHIRDNCTEVSSRAVHRYNPATDDYTKLADLPIAIDDHVQAVYADSLLYVITGWSNSTNVLQVQIYDPSQNEWTMGTPVPNDPEWRVFGASGSIINNTIYYSGGASLTCNNTVCFGPSKLLRRGDINPNDPTQITWSSEETDEAIGYRMAAVAAGSNFMWLGGADLTYNFDGIDYNGTGGVEPNQRITTVNLAFEERAVYENVLPPSMDFRGIGKLDNNNFILCGGMRENQTVSDKVYQVTVSGLVATKEYTTATTLFPNPAADEIHIAGELTAGRYYIFDAVGNIISNGAIQEELDISFLNPGMYILTLQQDSKPAQYSRFIKVSKL